MNENTAPLTPGSMATRRPKVVIVGGGFAGAATARRLAGVDVDVLLVDRRNHAIFQPLLYQVATAVLSASEISGSLRQFARAQPNLSVRLAEVRTLDLFSQELRVDAEDKSDDRIPYDFLVVATGVRPTYFGNDAFAPFAPSLKTLTDAELIRSKILKAFEFAEWTKDPLARASALTIVLVGAGPTGVELAASIAQMVRVTFKANFRNLNVRATQILVLEGAPRILGGFDEALSMRALRRLQSLGVTVRTGVTVESVDLEGVMVAGERICSKTVIWTAGVQASQLLSELPGERDRAGRICVTDTLSISAASNVFVVGDAATLKVGNKSLPGVAQVAIQQGHFVAERIDALIRNRAPVAAFKYRDRGNMAIVGKNFAIFERAGLRSSGFFTFLMWVALHVLFLPFLQNRLQVCVQWSWSYFSGQRGSRVISEKANDT